MIHDSEGHPLGLVLRSRSGRYFIRWPDRTFTPARWLTYYDARQALEKGTKK